MSTPDVSRRFDPHDSIERMGTLEGNSKSTSADSADASQREPKGFDMMSFAFPASRFLGICEPKANSSRGVHHPNQIRILARETLVSLRKGGKGEKWNRVRVKPAGCDRPEPPAGARVQSSL